MMVKNKAWKTLYQFTIFSAILSLTFACGEQPKQEPDETLKKAFDVHNESVAIRQSISESMTSLQEIQDSLFIAEHGRELDSLYTLVEAWDDQLIEVPGFEHSHHHHDHSHGDGHDHDHHHHHHHDHDHMEDLDLSSEEHLEIQNHLKKEISALDKALSELAN